MVDNNSYLILCNFRTSTSQVWPLCRFFFYRHLQQYYLTNKLFIQKCWCFYNNTGVKLQLLFIIVIVIYGIQIGMLNCLFKSLSRVLSYCILHCSLWNCRMKDISLYIKTWTVRTKVTINIGHSRADISSNYRCSGSFPYCN